MISVVRRKFITSCSSVFTKAPAETKRDSFVRKIKTQFCGNCPQSKNKTPKAGVKVTYDSEAGESQVLKRTGFAHSV